MFSAKILAYMPYLMKVLMVHKLTTSLDIVSFEQLGPGGIYGVSICHIKDKNYQYLSKSKTL